MKKVPIIEFAKECLSIRVFDGKAGLDILWGELGNSIELFIFGVGEVDITFTPLPKFAGYRYEDD